MNASEQSKINEKKRIRKQSFSLSHMHTEIEDLPNWANIMLKLLYLNWLAASCFGRIFLCAVQPFWAFKLAFVKKIYRIFKILS